MKITMTTSLRNGLKWREGRPRWEPSPAARKDGIKGRDLKDLQGRWIDDRGLAISLADDRLRWTRSIRDAMATGAAGIEARERLGAVLELLAMPKDEAAQMRRANVADLVEKARALVENRAELKVASNGPTIADLVSEYFRNPPKDATENTLVSYSSQAKKIVAKFGRESIHAVTTGRLYNWYHHELIENYSVATANQVIGTLGSLYLWAARADWIKPSDTPVRKLGQIAAEGRLVTWPFELEKTAVAWCDANGYADVADMIVAGCWIGARQVDICPANLGDLSASTWLYTPIKTQRKKLDALPSILPAVKARVDRRRAELANDGVTYLNPDQAPFLFNPETKRRHTSRSIGNRFSSAREAMGRAAAKGNTDLAGILDMHLQDTRDTCVTRLFYACDMELKEITPWTGHSLKSAEKILRHHYISLQRAGAMKTGDKLAAYAERQGWTA